MQTFAGFPKNNVPKISNKIEKGIRNQKEVSIRLVKYQKVPPLLHIWKNSKKIKKNLDSQTFF